MKYVKFFFTFSFTIALILALNIKIGKIPPLGKLLDPFNGFWQNSEATSPYADLSIELDSLKSEVTITFDEHLVPHISAENEQDLYFAQGYVTAYFRLWQMEFQTHAAAGRLSEIIGNVALDYDRLQRRKGLMKGAENALRAMKKDTVIYPLLKAYSAGVNAYISSLTYKDLPVEYKLLDYWPESWSPLKSALLLKYMADNLSGFNQDLENTNALTLFGEEDFNLLFPDSLPGIDPVIPKGQPWTKTPKSYKKPSQPFPNIITSKTLDRVNPENGSNNWAISGNRTASGRPILANDPHLGLNLPSLWFLTQLSSTESGINVYGATLPGAMGVIIGFNDSIAWGVTNARRDVVDWYKIKFNNTSRKKYSYDKEWLVSEKRIEKIKIRGEKTFYDTVIYTRYGPVVYDRAFHGDAENVNYAMRWIAHDPSLEQRTFYELNKSKNYSDFKGAIQYYDCPAQNFAFASIQDTIAMWIQGKFPLKWKNQGKFLMDGANPEQEWQGYIPSEDNAYVVNPTRGFVSSANQYPVDSAYPYYVYDGHYEYFRNRRINEKLSVMNKVTLEDMMKLQNDTYSRKAADVLQLMLDSLPYNKLNTKQKEIFTLLKEWNYYNNIDEKAPTIFHEWWNNLKLMYWDELDNDSVALILPTDYNTIHVLKEKWENPFTDIRSTSKKEKAKDLIYLSFIDAVKSLDEWQKEHDKIYNWGDYKQTVIQHLARLEPFSITDIRVPGSKHSINANSVKHGASLRILVELGNPIKAYGVYPGGQSGNPGSVYYANFVEKWRVGDYMPMYFFTSTNHFDEKVLFNMYLKPQKN